MTTDTLAYYSAHGAALFPIPAGSKAPGSKEFWPVTDAVSGVVQAGSFKKDNSTDPKQWAAWSAANPGCNFGVVAFASQWIICDPDADKVGREAAWQAWCDLCAEWGIPVAMPHVQSARGGWHIYFQVPPHVDASTLRQPDAIKGIINVRCVGYVVAAGSTFVENGVALPYLLMSDQAPHPCPDALLAHCTRVATRPNGATLPGARDKGDVTALLQWLTEHDAFADYESWFQCGMALKVEYGDDGFDLWEITHDGTVTPDVATSKWESFATEPTAQSVTLNSFLDRAHKMGWRGTVRKSTAAMFDGVAQIAAAAGASLSSGMPLPPGSAAAGLPMLAGQEELARLASPILAEFLTATADAPARPLADEFPTLPDSMSSHGLYGAMQDVIARVMVLSEPPQKFRPSRIIDVLAVLNVLHNDVFEAVCRRVRTMGHTLPDRKIKLAAANLSEKVERITVTHDKWEYDAKGEIQSDNSDNVQVLLGILGLSLRWNAWLERMEIQGGIDVDLRWKNWTYIDDTVVAKLRTRANRTKTRFRPGKEFLWEALLALAHTNTVDPALEMLSALEAEWDGTARLSNWLADYCGTPDDPYHRAVGRSLIGGMVTRVRTAGVKFDTMPIFFGPQGTGKSTMLAILALRPEFFTDNILLGDASKELVLSLAGKMLVEISEMGMRGNTNASHVKAMISRTTDAGRTAYARAVTERPRRNIFCGSTNDDSPLEDPSGNRRFLPVRVDTEVNLAALRRDVGQLVGEAAALHSKGTSFDIPREIWTIAAAHQEAARSIGDMETRLCAWFGETQHTATAFVATADLADLCDIAGWRNVHALRNSIMKRLGFREVHPYINGERTRGWLRGPNMMPRHIEHVTRYAVGKTTDGRPRVIIRGGLAPGMAPPPY